jgi:hypothetical protein
MTVVPRPIPPFGWPHHRPDDEEPVEAAAPRHTTSLAVARELLLGQMAQLAAPGADARLIAPLMLWGPPGIGKSDLIRALCEENGWGFVDVRLAQRDPVDLRGLPVPENGAVKWLPSSEWPRDAGSRGILLFDELTAADRTLQVAAYELILDRRLGDTYQVPPGWLVCGAGNRAEDSSVSLPMSAALANRFLHLDLAVDVDQWSRWALRHGLRPDLIAFLRHRPQLLIDMARSDLQRGWPSPRSWARVSAFLDGAAMLSEQARQTGLVGLVGEGPALELKAYLDITSKLPDFGAVLRGEATLDVPTKADLKLAVVTGLARHVWLQADRGRALGILLGISQRLTSDFATALVADAIEAAPAGGFEELFHHPSFAQWRLKHGTELSRRMPAVAPVLEEQAGQGSQRKPVPAAVLEAMRQALRR